MADTETRPRRCQFSSRRDADTSRDRLETETSRPRPQPCLARFIPRAALCLTRTIQLDRLGLVIYVNMTLQWDNNFVDVTLKIQQNYHTTNILKMSLILININNNNTAKYG